MTIDPMNALVNNFKMASILTPILEAVEINKRTEGVPNLRASDLLQEVMKAGVDIYQQTSTEKGKMSSMPHVSDTLFLLLSMCIRNSTVLYNSPNLNIIKDDLIALLKENADFISKHNQAFSTKQGHVTPNPSIPCAISSLSTLFIPVWLFHSNIFTSGLINIEQMNDLNSKVCFYLKGAVETMIDRSAPGATPELRAHVFFLCAESASKILVDYQIKLLKSKDVMMQYLKDPDTVLSRVLPVMQSAWVTLNECVLESIKNLTSAGR